MTKYSRLLGALLLGAATAQFAISAGVSAYVTLGIGLVLLVFSKSLTKYGLIGMVQAIAWYHGKRLPGHRYAPGVLNWVQVQLTATGEDRARRAENARKTEDYQAAQRRHAELRERYKDVEYTPGDIADFFSKHAVEVACLAVVSDGSAAVRSRLGGVPRLHAMSDWPRSDATNLPLHFLAELDLAEIPRVAETQALPGDGILMFFCDLGTWSSPRVIFQESVGAVSTAPEDLPDINTYLIESVRRPDDLPLGLMPEFAVRPVPRRVLRPTSDLPEDVDRNLVTLARKHGEAVFAEFIAQQDGLRLTSKHYNLHTIGGPASDVPNPTGGRGFKLLQLDSDTELGLMIGDSGILEFWIDLGDLQARRFENVRWAVASA